VTTVHDYMESNEFKLNISVKFDINSWITYSFIAKLIALLNQNRLGLHYPKRYVDLQTDAADISHTFNKVKSSLYALTEDDIIAVEPENPSRLEYDSFCLPISVIYTNVFISAVQIAGDFK
jgi:hypothetical protein